MRRFKSVICMTVIASLFLLVLCPLAGALSFIRGDADTDGKVSVLDATAIQKVRASIPVSSYDEIAADVDGDNVVSVLDATYIQKSLAHIEIPYAVGEVVTIEETTPETEETDAPTQAQEPSYIPGENELPFIPNR